MSGTDLDEFSDRPFDDPVERQHHRRAAWQVERWVYISGLAWRTGAWVIGAIAFVVASRSWLGTLLHRASAWLWGG